MPRARMRGCSSHKQQQDEQMHWQGERLQQLGFLGFWFLRRQTKIRITDLPTTENGGSCRRKSKPELPRAGLLHENTRITLVSLVISSSFASGNPSSCSTLSFLLSFLSSNPLSFQTRYEAELSRGEASHDTVLAYSYHLVHDKAQANVRLGISLLAST